MLLVKCKCMEDYTRYSKSFLRVLLANHKLVEIVDQLVDLMSLLSFDHISLPVLELQDPHALKTALHLVFLAVNAHIVLGFEDGGMVLEGNVQTGDWRAFERRKS